MIVEITKDKKILTQKSERFVFGEDDYIIQNLIDTAEANKENCLGLAAIQLGYAKKVLVVKQGDKFIPYINPTIVSKSVKTYVTQEGCLSVEGVHTVRRHKDIKLAFTDVKGKLQLKTFTNLLAQVIQHECDHLNGVLI